MLRLIQNKHIATAVLILMVSVLVGGTLVFVGLSASPIKVFAQGEGGSEGGTGGTGTGGTDTGGYSDESGGPGDMGFSMGFTCANQSAGPAENDRPDEPIIIPRICPDGSLQPSHQVSSWSGSADNGSESWVTVYDPCPLPPPPTTICTPFKTTVDHACNVNETGTGRTYESTSNTCTPGVWSLPWVLIREDCHPGGGGGGDVCPNIPGNQSSVPAGKVVDSSGNCVDGGGGGGGGDVCPNIPGNQSSVPAGKVVDSSGNCVDGGGGPRCLNEGELCGTSAENKCKMKNYAHYQCSGTTSVCPAITAPDDALCTPPIISLKIVPPEIKQGEKCAITWTVAGIIPEVTVCGLTGVGVSDGCNEMTNPGSCVGRPGGTVLTPALDLTTRYTLTCMNGTPASIVTKTGLCAITPIIFEPSDASGSSSR